MPTFKITKNPYGSGSSKIIETNLSDDVMEEVLKGFTSFGKHKDGNWRAQLNKVEERNLSAKLERTCGEIDRREAIALAQAAAEAENVVALHDLPKRVVVEAGKHKPGQRVGNRVITKLGREWRMDSQDTSAHGLGPWVEWVQYAYFD